MSEINTGWLEDKEGVTFAPKTLVDSVQDADGTPLRDMIGGSGSEIDADRVIMADGKSVEETVTTLKTSLNDIGKVDAEYSIDATIPSGAWTTVKSFNTNKKGILIVNVLFPSGTQSGLVGIRVTSSNATNSANATTQIGGTTAQIIQNVTFLTEASNLPIQVFQNVSTSLKVTYTYRFIEL